MRSLGDSSLDDVMRNLWHNWKDGRPGVEDDEIQNIICELSGIDLRPFLSQLIHQTSELPLEALLKTVGVDLIRRSAINQADKGGKPAEDALPAVSFGAFLKEQGRRFANSTSPGRWQCAVGWVKCGRPDHRRRRH